MTVYVIDAEWLIQEDKDVVLEAESLHCVVLRELGSQEFIEFSASSESNNSLAGLGDWFRQQKDATYIGHNILTSDLEVFRRLLGIPFTVGRDSVNGQACTFIDTLTWSRRLNPDRPPAMYRGKSMGVHGLFAWATRLNGYKPEVTDWVGLPVETYLERCRADVVLTEQLYNYFLEEEI